MDPATITIGIDPELHIGPLTIAWHGLMTAVGIAVAALLARRYARERELDPDGVLNAALVMAIAGIIGARLFFLAVSEPDDLLRPGEWLGARGFAIYGAVIAGPLAAALYARRAGLDRRVLDALAAGFPLGLAVGRVGDVINGEHYGPATDLAWGIRYTDPDAEVPGTMLAYHSGGLYELLLGLALFALIWPLRHRLRRPLTLFWTVIGLYGAGRFAMFFYRSDSDQLALGLNEARWVSLALVGAGVAGAAWSARRRAGERPPLPAAGSAGVHQRG